MRAEWILQSIYVCWLLKVGGMSLCTLCVVCLFRAFKITGDMNFFVWFRIRSMIKDDIQVSLNCHVSWYTLYLPRALSKLNWNIFMFSKQPLTNSYSPILRSNLYLRKIFFSSKSNLSLTFIPRFENTVEK